MTIKRTVVTTILAVLASLFLLFTAKPANARHLQNDQSNFCARISLSQIACAASATQDFAFDDATGGTYLIRNGSLCLVASSGTIGAAITTAACSDTAAQRWKVYRDTASSTTRQYQNGLGNCLGTDSASSGAALEIVDCTAASAEWEGNGPEFATSLLPGGTTVPVFAITGGNIGARVVGADVAVGTLLNCDAFASGGFCALASNTARATFGRPTGGRTLASNKALTVTTRPTAVAGSIPTPASVAARGLPVVGKITATSGQVIQNVHIVTDVGPCIFIPEGVHDVTIQDNEIGPCTQAVPPDGEHGLNDRIIYSYHTGDNIIVRRNVMHDGSFGWFFQGGSHMQAEKNYVYNILGPRWGGSVFQIGGLDPVGSSPQTKINCNIINGRYTTGAVRAPVWEDKINIGGSARGTSAKPLEIAYNRILGPAVGGGDSGSGMEIGDLPTNDAGWYYVHDNTIVYTNGGGITVTGGHDIRIENNRVDNRGENTDTNTGQSFGWSTYYPPVACTRLTYIGNSGVTTQWYYGATGAHVPGANEGNCTAVTKSGNNFDDTSLTGIDMFNEEYDACN